ncbi:MAG: DUF998 domain-containing protein [Dehalococcoidia bacterium]|nr:MAG: DUF998 domain-containing protein [Dehalococcoidia bacterium]
MAQRLLAISGVLGPPIYAILVITLGALWPDYSHVKQSMSELGSVGAPHALVMNTAGLQLLGILLTAFALGLHRGLGSGRSARIGCSLVAISGIAIFMTGVFQCDAHCIDTTKIGITHSIFATISALAMMLSPFALLPALGNDSRWRRYVLFSLMIGIMVAILSGLYGLDVFEQWKGVMQRLSLGVALLWIEVMAIKLLRLSQVESLGYTQQSSRQLQ